MQFDGYPSIFTKLCDHHHCLIPEYFITPKRSPTLMSSYFPFPALTQTLATTHLPPVPMDWPILDVSCKWSHTICDLLGLASFADHGFKVHPCCSMVFCSFCGWVTFLCVDIPHLVSSFSSWWILGLFLLFVYKKCCCERLCISFCVNMCFQFPRVYTWAWSHWVIW